MVNGDKVIEVEDLTKVYPAARRLLGDGGVEKLAVDRVSFDVRRGEIFGLLGPNGAGKTTTIECLEGLRKPDQGTIRVLGVDPQRESHILRERTGTQLQQSNLPDRMKVWEALDLYSAFYPNPVAWKELLVQLGLEEKRNAPFAKLSGGQKQRLFIALALLPDPQLVFLDELTTGLDPQARHAIWDLVRNVRAQGKTVFLTTHFMEEAERLCDRVAVLDHGRIVALDTPAALIHGLEAEERVIFVLDGGLSPALEKALTGMGQLEVRGTQVTIHGKNGRAVPIVSEVVSLLTGQGVAFRDLRTEQPNLEDVFLSLTGREMRE